MKALSSWWKDVKKGFSNFGNGLSSAWNTITGQNEEKHANKAEELAEQSQQWNENFSEKQLAQNDAQFARSQALAEENLSFQRESADKNFQMQQDVFNAQQRENELTRQREDNAYQRQVADLKAAGLSPLMASNGAGATAVQVGSAPQMETSGISSAYGSYIQMAKEFAELKNMASGQYASRRQQAINERIGASMALSQMYANRRNLYANNALSGINIATNIAGLRKRNMLLDEQIDNAKALRKWSNNYGWRNLNNWSVLIPALNKISESLGIDYDKFGNLMTQFANDIKDKPYQYQFGSDKSFNELKDTTEILKDSEISQDLFETMLNNLNDPNKKTFYSEARDMYKGMSKQFQKDWDFEDFYKALNHQEKKLTKRLVLYLNFDGWF